MKIDELLDGIGRLDIVLPEFQREYVWSRPQAKQLLVSLVRGYPTGSILIWKTDTPPDIKNNAVPKDHIGTTSVLLDGQQRLTTLYLFAKNAIPPYYRVEDIGEDPRNLWYDLDTGEFQYYSKQRMEASPTWVQVTSCFETAIDKEIDVFKIAQQRAVEGIDSFPFARRYDRNLTTLRNILLQDYPVQTVPANATITDAINVFDLVNSQGTKLSEAELALAHVTGTWPVARREMKSKIAALTGQRFTFDLTFMVRSLTVAVRNRALFETIHQASRDELETGWKTVSRLLDYLVTMLPTWGFVNSAEDLNTTNVLVPAVAYLANHGGTFASERNLRDFIHWMYAASVWTRYTSQTDQRLDHDISIVARSANPWRELLDAIIDQRGRIDVKAADLEGRGYQHPLYRMTYVLVKANGGVDWCNGAHLDQPHGAAYALHSHHIFPQARLYGQGGYDPENHLHKQIVNEIANRAFLTGPCNLGIADKLPAEYLPEVETRYPGSLQKQFVPLDPALWELGRYEDFLEARRQLIADAFNRRMSDLVNEAEQAPEPPLEDLVALGESPTVEFKSSLRWDVVNGVVNKDLQKQVTKTVSAMLNSDGGVLLIGVADDGAALGLDPDLRTLPKPDLDGYSQALIAVIAEYLGPEFGGYVHVDYPVLGRVTICRVRMDASPRPVFVTTLAGVEFDIRVGPTTRALDPQTTHDYIGMHWQ